MVRIYLDVETYRPRKEDAWIKEKVIAIGVFEDRTPYKLESIEKSLELKSFTEWNLSSEERIIKDFYEYIEDRLSSQTKSVEVVGFNILRFDIPLLIQKGVEYKVKSLDELNHLWHDSYTRDLFQELLPANKQCFKGLRLPRVIEVMKELEIPCPVEVEEHGEKVREAYEKKEFNKIEEWLIDDLKATRYLDLSGAIQKLFLYAFEKNMALFKPVS